MMKLCIDCAHCVITEYHYDTYSETNYDCYYSDDLPTSPVNGEKYGLPRQCRTMRGTHGVCGASGRLWVKKDD